MKRKLLMLVPLVFGLLTARTAAAFTNNRYLAYGRKQTSLAIQSQVLGSYTVNDGYIEGLVTNTVDKLMAEGMLKGQKGDKGDAGQSVQSMLGPSVPADGTIAAAPIVYDSNIPGNIGGFTELSAGDLTAGTSFTVSAGAPVEIGAGSLMEVDANALFTAPTTMASTTMSDLSVNTIESGSGAFLSPGGVWTNASSRELKENFATVTPADILTKIDSLPIYTWNYKKESPNVVHMGPVAEDFYSAFGLGNSSTSISTIDPAGVALAGIQGLDAKLSSLLNISWILDGLKNLGTDIEQGFIKVESVIAQTIQTGQLEVGSPDQPTGITLYDTVTKQPVCVFSANNVLQEQAGNCQTGLTAAAVPGSAPTLDSATTFTPEQIPLTTQSATSTDTPILTPTTDSVTAEPTTTGASILTQVSSGDLISTSTDIESVNAFSASN